MPFHISWLNRLHDNTGLIIFDEHGERVNTAKFEYPEQVLAKKYINPTSCVLELGARYGSVSCTINKKLLNKHYQVSVEPDPLVWEALHKNLKLNNCARVNVHRGIVGKSSTTIIQEGYASYVVPSSTSDVSSLSVEDLQVKYGLKFDTLVADCEGFLETFFDEHPFMYDQLKMVIFEADAPQRCDYDKIRRQLILHGFNEIEKGFQNVYIK
jgi:FkbM family methyltransferase